MEGLKQLIDYGIIGLLIALSLWAVAVAMERWYFFRRVDVSHFRSEQECEIALTKRLVVIGTVAANAPYIGLLGTVLGVMNAFLGMGQKGSGNIAAVAPGIAEALITTVAGIGAAIPALMAYNYFAAKAGQLEGELEGFASGLIGWMAREGWI